MRTREMLYKDWGISEQRRRELMRAAPGGSEPGIIAYCSEDEQ